MTLVPLAIRAACSFPNSWNLSRKSSPTRLSLHCYIIVDKVHDDLRELFEQLRALKRWIPYSQREQLLVCSF